jgi:hypothetical protein
MADKGKPVKVDFDKSFLIRDQDVQDLSNPRPETKFLLLELPKDELATLEAGECFRFQSHSNGGAALCSSSKTFSLEFLENSNSQFLGFVTSKATEKDGEAEASEVRAVATEEMSRECLLFAQVRGNMVVRNATGDTSRIHEMVSQSKFELEPRTLEEELSPKDGTKNVPVTMLELEHNVAASSSEIQACLDEGPYAEHKGVWKLLTPEFERELIDISLSVVTANGWEKESVDGEALLKAVRNQLGDAGEDIIPSLDVLKKVLRSVLASPKRPVAGTQNAAAKPESSAATAAKGIQESTPATAETAAVETEPTVPPLPPGIIPLDVQKMERFQAVQLLHMTPADVRHKYQLSTPGPRPKRSRLATAASAATGRDQPLLLSEFITAFREATGSEATEEHVLSVLGDSARHDEMEGTIHVLDVYELPMEARARLKRLFEMQSHWRSEMLERLLTPTLATVKPAVWLQKNARQTFIEFEPGKEERMLVKKFQGL